ncbi:MAG: AsmA family protein, partial [Pseudomonadota bacterium]|nr:AsmA family protein [Pseudomonadota bacterium]
MKPALKVLIWIPVVLIVLIVGFNIFLLTFDLNAYRGRLESLLSETLGRQIELRGKIGFEPSLVPTVSLRDVVIGNPQWASRPAFATAGRVTCQLALMPLLENRIEIARFAIGQADILFERGPNDSNNWK